MSTSQKIYFSIAVVLSALVLWAGDTIDWALVLLAWSCSLAQNPPVSTRRDESSRND